MSPFSVLSKQAKAIEVVRWLCVLPAALLGAMAVRLPLGAVIRLARDGGGNALIDSSAFYWIATAIFHLVPEFVFVLAGASLAPRRRNGTAIVLSLVGIGLSLLTHILMQHLAGNRVGLTNYVHVGSETVGAIAGAIFCAMLGRRNANSAMGGKKI